MKLFCFDTEPNSFFGGGNFKEQKTDSLQVSFSHSPFSSEIISWDEKKRYDLRGWYMGCFFIHFNPAVYRAKLFEILEQFNFGKIAVEDADSDKILKKLEIEIEKVINAGFKSLDSKITLELCKDDDFNKLVTYYKDKQKEADQASSCCFPFVNLFAKPKTKVEMPVVEQKENKVSHSKASFV